MTKEERDVLIAELEALSSRIINEITPEEALKIREELDARFIYGTEEYEISDKVLIDTGAGETLSYLIDVANYTREMQENRITSVAV